jgi:hypothetical protein
MVEENLDLIKKIHPSDKLNSFSVGKYDPNNRHIWILDTLGISPEDLQQMNQTSSYSE